MTLLIGAIISIMVSVLKTLSEKIGVDMAKNLVLVLVFIGAFAYSALSHYQIISVDVVREALVILTNAVGFYEVVIKRIITPAFK